MPIFSSVETAPEPAVKPAPAKPDRHPAPPQREEPSPLQPRKPSPNTCPRPRVDPGSPDVETCQMINLSDHNFKGRY